MKGGGACWAGRVGVRYEQSEPETLCGRLERTKDFSSLLLSPIKLAPHAQKVSLSTEVINVRGAEINSINNMSNQPGNCFALSMYFRSIRRAPRNEKSRTRFSCSCYVHEGDDH